MASSILPHHRPFFTDDAPPPAHSFEPFEAHPDDSLYTSPPLARDTTAIYQRNSDSPTFDDPSASAFHPHNHMMNHQSIHIPLYQQPDSLAFHGPLDFSSNPFQTSTAFSSATRNRQQAGTGSSGALSHQSSLSALYRPDVGFPPPAAADIFPPSHLPQQSQQAHDYPQNVHQSSQLPMTNGFSDNPSFESYDFESTSRGVRHQSSFGGQSNRGAGMLNGVGGPGASDPPALPAGNAALQMSSVGSGNTVPVNGATSSYNGGTSGPTLRDTLRDAREPRDPSADTRGFGRDNNGTGASANSGQQEEISTIFVVGFPDDMQEREFQNMFTFSRGFEAATLKIPNKDSTAYNGVANQSLNASTGGTSTSNNPPSERRGTITNANYGGASDPYNLVTVNSGGVVVDSRDLPGGTQTSAVWPGSTTGQGQSQVQQPPRKQIIGFAKFATRADALHARDVLQSKRVDAEKSAVLKAEMAKKNLHTKRGVGGPSGNPAPNGLGTQPDIIGARNGAPAREQGPAANIYNSLATSGIFGSSNGSGLPLVNGALSQIHNPNSITSDLHTSFALSVREREQAALAAMGVSSTLGARPLGPVRPELGERDYLEERMTDHHLRQQQQQDNFPHSTAPYHQSESASRTSSTSSFSPESTAAIHNPITQQHFGEVDADSRAAEDRVNTTANGFVDGDANATPVANRSGWPMGLRHTEVNFRQDQWRHALERQEHSQPDQTSHHQHASGASSPLSASALQIQHSADVHFELERERAEGSASFDAGIGDTTLTTLSRPASRAASQCDFTPSNGEQPLLTASHHVGLDGSAHEDSSHSTYEPEQCRESVTLHPPVEPSSEDEAPQNDENAPMSANRGAGKWPSSASATSASSMSEPSSLAHESDFSGDLRFHEALRKQRQFQLTNHEAPNREVASSTRSSSPPEVNGIPASFPPRVEEDERDQISPLHQLGFQTLHHHLPLNHLPRHQLSGQPGGLQQHRVHESDRSLHFNESIFDTRGSANRSSNDLGTLEARFNEFTTSNTPPTFRETSPPISSPPLQPMNPVSSGRGSSHDARPNIDQNPPINTLYVGNLPTIPSSSTTNVLLEENLRLAFSRCPGYRKLCFRQKSNGPMCFVEFEDVHYATKALSEMYGHTLNGLIKNGIRLSYSKNPLGVRSPSMSNGSGVGNGSLTASSGFHSLQEVPSGRHVSVDNGRYGGKGSSYVDTNAPPRRQQLRDESLQDNRAINNLFDGSVVGPRTIRQMSIGPGVGLGAVGDFANGGLGAISEQAFGRADIGGPGNGTFLPPTTSPPPRLSTRYFSTAPGDARSALSPILSNSGGSAFSSLSGLGGNYNQPEIVSPQHQQPPVRSTFSPFHNDIFGVEHRSDAHDQFERDDSLVGHFPSGIHDGGATSTLYNSISFAPLNSNGSGEPR